MTLPETDADVLLLHNPRCSKSRATAALLEERGIAYTERRYLEDPLSEDELAELERRLDRPLGEWIRRKERAFAELGLDAASDEGALRSAVAREPILMERPIVVRGRRARIGRPPGDVLDLFDED